MRTASVARIVVDTSRHVLGIALIAVSLVLLVRFGLQFPHPAKWDTLGVVVQLRRWGDPLLAQTAAVLGMAWPARPSYLPLGLAVVFWFVRTLLVAGLERAGLLLEDIERARAARAAARRAAAAPPRLVERTAPAIAPPTPVAVEAPAPPAPSPAAPSESTDHSETRVLEAPAAAKARAQTIGRYEILAELGRGAMGVVYKGHDPTIGRTVAIKSILTANLSSESLEGYKKRFFVEAQAAGKLTHQGIVAVHDVVEDQAGQPGIVMEFVEGTTLDRLVATERPTLGATLDIIAQVALALDYAHNQGVVHRDIKPANILVTREGRAKVSDFGIAKLAGVQLTTTGQLIGTPAFMSPEQFMGAAVDRRSDLFSLGSVLYWLCTGEKAFPGDTITAISYKVVHMPTTPARQLNPALPAGIDFVLARCLAKNTAERYQTGRELASDLEALRAGRPVEPAAKPGNELPPPKE